MRSSNINHLTILPIRLRLVFAVLVALGLTVGCDSGSGNNSTMQQSATNTDDQASGSGEGADPVDNENPDSNETENPDDLGMENPDGMPDITNTEFEAMYRATFNATWSSVTHPTNFPGDPHFSPLHGAVHGAQTVLWSRGDIATDGIELMAETGDTTLLDSEAQFAVDEGRALSVVYGGSISLSPGSVSVEFLVNRTHPQITLVSMLAPSPDWFVGVDGAMLLGDDGTFIDAITIDLRLYDAGTDNGQEYTSADEDTQPRSPITLVNSFPSQTPFIDGEPGVGQLVIEKIQ